MRLEATPRGYNSAMASYAVNKPAVAKARHLIEARQYVLESDWGEAQPTAESENAFLGMSTRSGTSG